MVARDHGRHFLGAEFTRPFTPWQSDAWPASPTRTGSFPNLKTLRDYCEQTGQPVRDYRFDVQTGGQTE